MNLKAVTWASNVFLSLSVSGVALTQAVHLHIKPYGASSARRSARLPAVGQ